MATTTNPFLSGNYAPVDEEVTAIDLEVTGSLPPSLVGLLARNGPNPATERPANHHWFLGDAMVHGIRIEEGRARWYRNRWIRTPALEEQRDLPAAPRSPVDQTLGGGGGVHVIGHAGRILALGEVGLPYELDGELDTVGQYDFDRQLSTNMTAHPHEDPDTGELLFFGYDFGPTRLRYHVADAQGRLVRTEAIETPETTMMHDFGVTASRVVFMDLPVVFDLGLLGTGTMPFSWSEDHGARLGVMPRDGGGADVRWVEIDPCYVFHVLNAFDDEDRVVMDVLRYPTMFAHSRIGPNEPELATLHRWTIDPVAGSVKEEHLDDTTVEFPRHDERLVGRPYRYGYAIRIAGGDAFDTDAIVRWDLERGTTEVNELGPGRAPSEALFVPEGPGETDGWLLSIVYDATRDRSDVVVLDASSFGAEPVATIHLPARVPFGFHGSWIADGA